MNEAGAIWRLGRWIGTGRGGTVRLRSGSGEAILRLAGGQLTGFEGPPPECVGEALGVPPAGHADLIREARELAGAAGVPLTRALAAVKVCLEKVLTAWLLDPDREIVEEAAAETAAEAPAAGPAISLTHVMVELLLAADEGAALADRVLPSDGILLRRTPGFLERYAALQLAEEADLVVAKVTGGRTVEAIAERSSHDAGDVRRLLAALVAAGLLEPVSAREPEPEPEPGAALAPPQSPEARPSEPAPAAGPERTVRRLPWPWLLLAAAVLVAVLAVGAVWFRHAPAERPAGGRNTSWGIVVDMGCEAVDYERILRKVRKHPQRLRAVRTDEAGDGTGCWRLVWGPYRSKEAADRAVRSIPGDALAEGFEPHVVELDSTQPEEGTASP